MKTIEMLRGLRTFAYWAAGPVDSGLARIRGVKGQPPLWLRRHVGRPAHFASSAAEIADWIDRLKLLDPQSSVLDIGCGCGAMVPELAQRLASGGRYLGFDVHGPSIRWCRKHYAVDQRLGFELAPVASPYATTDNAQPVDSYRFPAPAGGVDLALAKSVFTHLLEDEARHYLAEIRRVLAPSGRALVSFFLFEGENGGVPAAFPHPDDAEATLRWRLAGRPHAAVAYRRTHALGLITAAGLEVREFIEGFWPGTAPNPKGQDQLVLAPVGG